MAATKFSTEPRLLLLSVATLIMLSDRILLWTLKSDPKSAVVTQEPRQCYWCGPLAEQVHRSARAPACNAPNQVTTCDPGLDYCAVVATAPPYIESRYCVKNYRDECYPLYCNTTRAWKMICPCKENLCNGPNTEREKEAFATLMKLVETNRTKRIGKRTGLTGKFINTEKTKIITNISGIQENMLNGTFEEKKEQFTEIILSSESLIDTVGNFEDNNIDNIESTTANDVGEAVTDETEDTPIDDIKLTEIESVKDEIIPIVTTNMPLITNIPQMSTSIQKPIAINQIDDTPKPSEVLPTAEALLQNASPSPVVSEKVTEPTTTTVETTTLLTTAKDETPTNQTVKNNGDINMNSSVFLIAITFFVQFLAL